jgi:hypothetical protein
MGERAAVEVLRQDHFHGDPRWLCRAARPNAGDTVEQGNPRHLDRWGDHRGVRARRLNSDDRAMRLRHANMLSTALTRSRPDG